MASSRVRPWTISQQVYAEGVRRIALVSDDPGKYRPGTQWAPGVTFHHRDKLDEVSSVLAQGLDASAEEEALAELAELERQVTSKLPDAPSHVVLPSAPVHSPTRSRTNEDTAAAVTEEREAVAS